MGSLRVKFIGKNYMCTKKREEEEEKEKVFIAHSVNNTLAGTIAYFFASLLLLPSILFY
jgi:hypothetical protein